MPPIFEFTTYLRAAADDEAAARRLAEEVAHDVSRGDITLALDDSPPSVDDEEKEPS